MQGSIHLHKPPKLLRKGQSIMMVISIPLLLSLIGLLVWVVNLCFSGNGKGKLQKLPPGPKPLPIIGNILQLNLKPHRALADLSSRYGPLMSLKLGSLNTLVVSSADMAREVFTKHDLAFSMRQVPDVLRACNHNLHSMAWLPVSPKWRDLRKLVVIQLFSARGLDDNLGLRHKKVGELREYIAQCCRDGQVVDIGRVGFTTTLNLLSNTLFSIDMTGYSSTSSQELKNVVGDIAKCAGKPNLADFFPFLSYFDPSGIRREATTHFSKFFAIFDDIIKKRLSTDSTDSSSKKDVLETLLRINQEDGSDLTLDDIKHILFDFYTAGTETTSNTLEWAMTQLLCSPSKMEKAQEEIDSVIGKNASVEESDIQSLPYLQAIVKETLRLHPPLPLLLPHKAQEDVELCGYHIPKNTQVLVNLYSIGLDPKTWEKPTEFLPERFLEGVNIDARGKNFGLIPFGAGRRICPGMPLADRMVHIMLATLLHGFGWKLPNGMTREEVDMDEKPGFSLQKDKPLLAVPIPKH